MTYKLLASTGPKPQLTKNSKGHTIVKLHELIEFQFEMDGKILSASITHAEDDKTRWLYRIAFSDGYKGLFTISRSLGCIIEKGDHAPSAYAKAINEDLKTIYQFDPINLAPFCLLVDVKGEPVKVWAKKEESGCWFVYFKSRPKFFLHFFSGRWQPEPLEEIGGYVVPEIANAVTDRLNEIIRLVAINAPSNN